MATEDDDIDTSTIRAANWHHACFVAMLVNLFDFTPSRAHILGELHRKRALWIPGPILNEFPGYWILDAVTNEAWQSAADWRLIEKIRTEFSIAFHCKDYDILEPSYDWKAAKTSCEEIVKRYSIPIVYKNADLETTKGF